MRPPRALRSYVEMEIVDDLLAELAVATTGADRRATFLAADQADVAETLVVCQRDQCRESRPMSLGSLIHHVHMVEQANVPQPGPGRPPLHELKHLRRATGSEYAAYAAESE